MEVDLNLYVDIAIWGGNSEVITIFIIEKIVLRIINVDLIVTIVGGLYIFECLMFIKN